jgi:hypothetical protein
VPVAVYCSVISQNGCPSFWPPIITEANKRINVLGTVILDWRRIQGGNKRYRYSCPCALTEHYAIKAYWGVEV